MKKVKYLILGAGPSGLGFAHALQAMGEESFLVIEREAVAGGLCRSVEVDGAPVDIGGGHFIEFRDQAVAELVFRYMPRSEWREFSRVSKINLRGVQLDYPLEANLWQLPVADQVDYLEAIAQAGCVQGDPLPESFEAWISWKLGERIAQEYMLPYNRKIWSVDLNDLGTYWLHKLPDVSFRQILQSCLERRPFGALPAHGTFLYPALFGSGELWRRLGEGLGERLLTNTAVTSVDIGKRVVNGCFAAEKIINTIPWPLWPAMAEVPEDIKAAIGKLRHAAIDVDYREQTQPGDAHWIYEPDERIPHHRILCRSNFIAGSRGYWTETNSRRSGEPDGWRHRNEFAYPLNTTDKLAVIAKILRWGETHGIHGLGRWGTWEHLNSDAAVSLGMAAARKLVSA